MGDRFGSFVVEELIFDGESKVRIACECGESVVRSTYNLKSRRQIKCLGCARSLHLAWGSFVVCGRHIGGAGNRTSDPAMVTCPDCKAGRLDAERWAGLILRRVRERAKARGFECDLTVEHLLVVRVGKPCTFCGGDVGGCVGLDRIDSRYGYVTSNVQPCCGPCNAAKGTLEDDEFRAAMDVRLAKTGRGRAWGGFKLRGNNGARG